jgi:crotonobetainyl-CoA:carnitine CoA-transferase CaiB-like acyl-CoA transferase
MSGPSAPEPRGALAGVRVLDCSRVLAGPYAGRLLADLGAEVLKLEPPAGDESREVAPKRDRGMSGLYTWANVGKRNVCLDLARPEGRAVAQELAARCDAVIENFRPGVAERLGLGWEAIRARNPRAVLVSVTGFGADSSWRDRRGFAHVVHAAAGVLHDQAERSGLPVAPLAQAFGDVATALHATIGLLAALREAARTGEGQHVEIAMFDATLASYTETVFALLDPPEARDTSLLFDAGSHGCLAVAGARPHVWRLLRERHGLVDPAPPGAPVPEKARLRTLAIEEWMAAQPSCEALVAAVEAAGLACAPVTPLREALTGPLARERALLAQVDDRRGGSRPVVRSPWRFSRSQAEVRGPAPRRGEHNAEVLREILGYDSERIEALRAAGVLGAEPADGP